MRLKSIGDPIIFPPSRHITPIPMKTIVMLIMLMAAGLVAVSCAAHPPKEKAARGGTMSEPEKNLPTQASLRPSAENWKLRGQKQQALTHEDNTCS